jgi:hypothetical protein
MTRTGIAAAGTAISGAAAGGPPRAAGGCQCGGGGQYTVRVTRAGPGPGQQYRDRARTPDRRLARTGGGAGPGAAARAAVTRAGPGT